MRYLDHNATTPMHPAALEEQLRVARDAWANPSSIHPAGEAARTEIERARRKLAKAIGARPDDLVFTSGGTESDNLAVRGLARAARRASGADGLAAPATEHPAVLDALRSLERDEGFRLALLPVDAEGRLDPSGFEAVVGEGTALVSIMAANNETGTLLPVDELAGRIRQLAPSAAIHTDAVQCLGRVALEVEALGVDAVSLSAHKCNGPKGVGALWLRPGTAIEAQQVGGSQEAGRRGGTENPAGAAAFAEAATRAAADREAHAAEWARLAALLRAELPGAWAGGVEFNTPESGALPNTLNASFRGVDGRRLAFELGRRGVAASAASACASHGHSASHVLAAMFPDDPERVAGGLRISFGRGSTEEDARALLEALPPSLEACRVG